jgi:hypothetical protein
MFKRFFGKKNDGFYMQAEESVDKAPEKKVPVVVNVAPTTVSEEKEELAIETSPSKTSVKDKNKDKLEKKASKQAAQNNEAVLGATVVSAEPAITNFATDYLIKPSSSSNRRRPGANMKQFMDMARQVEIKKSPGQRAKSN